MLYPKRLTQFTQEHNDALAAAICGLLLLLGWFALHVGWLGLALLILPAAYVIGGYESAREGLTTLFQEKELDVDLLMIVAAIGAAGLGFWRREYYLIIDGAILILIFAISGALEGYAMRRTERSIKSLMSLTQDTARVWRQGREEEVPISQLKVGDEIVVKPGELIPTDGLILSGYSSLNQAAITGESLPVDKTVGDEVFAGSLNGFGALKLKVHKPAESSLIQRVIRLVEQAQTEAPPSQQFIERFERGYAKVIVISGILLAIFPPFVWGWDWETTIYRALIFLVVASPCALMAAIMPTLLSGIANGAKQGILFKNGAQLELMGKVRAIAFDKTGTLTTGELEVSQVIPASGYSTTDVLTAAAALESCSEHPIGKAIVQAARDLSWVSATEVQAYPGQGIVGIEVDAEAMRRGDAEKGNVAVPPLPHVKSSLRQLMVGSGAFIQQHVASLPPKLTKMAAQLEQQGKTVVWVAQQGQDDSCEGDILSALEIQETGETPIPQHVQYQVIGIIAIADRTRTTAASTIAKLKALGIERIVMLTGDNQQTAQTIALELGIDEVYAELLPEDKLHVIRNLLLQYHHVAMVGDGINDAPALAQASVGIAMGAVGSDVALETADIVLMTDRLEKIASAIRLGRRAIKIVKQNIAIALLFLVLLLIANFLGNINLPIGVIGHEGSTVLVTLSGLRLLKS
jgi:Cd2+/Zn2+-exporting ATPase